MKFHHIFCAVVLALSFGVAQAHPATRISWPIGTQSEALPAKPATAQNPLRPVRLSKRPSAMPVINRLMLSQNALKNSIPIRITTIWSASTARNAIAATNKASTCVRAATTFSTKFLKHTG